MKRIAALLFVALVARGIAPATIKVVASTSDLAAIASAVGGDKTEVASIVQGAQNPHYIEVKPSYMLKLKKADIFFIVGLQLEIWGPQIIDGSRNANLRVVDCSAGITKLEVPAGKVDASSGDVHPYGNPHYWLDPENAKIIAKEMASAYSELDGGNADVYNRNLDAFTKELDAKIVQWKKAMEPLQKMKLVTYHSSFSYFAHRFGLQIAGYVEPKPGIPPTPSHTLELISEMRHDSIRIIGLEQYFEESVPDQIAKATGATVVPLATSVGGRPGTDTYTALIDYDVSQLVQASGPK